MATATVLSRAQVGLTAPLVRVEVHVGGGLPQFGIVGLPAPVVRESKDRVRAALASGGYDFPAGRITVNLAPAELPKEGGRFDLPIALGILLASGQLPCREPLEQLEFYGELSLTGRLKRVQGLLLAALQAAEAGHRVCGPEGNRPDLAEAGLAADWLLADLAGVVARVAGRAAAAAPASAPPLDAEPPATVPDLADVRGQAQGKRALTIAAAGGHHLLFVGPPGAGKSMLAQRLPGLLPPLGLREHREVAAIHSLQPGAGAARPRALPPFRSPHHTASAHAIVGGGPRATPGEISLAHRGVLFLDELPEFDRRVLEALREPLETGAVCIARAGLRAHYPAEFQLVAAMNPCPCGRGGTPQAPCDCSPQQSQRYRARLSGPLLDRIDLQVTLHAVGAALWDEPAPGAAEHTAAVAAAVRAARERQHARQGCLNGRLSAARTLEACRLEPGGLAALTRAAVKYDLSARSCHRIARVARSIADLDGAPAVEKQAVLEAVNLRLTAQQV
jgi:magnesium chelatase family protein